MHNVVLAPGAEQRLDPSLEEPDALPDLHEAVQVVASSGHRVDGSEEHVLLPRYRGEEAHHGRVEYLCQLLGARCNIALFDAGLLVPWPLEADLRKRRRAPLLEVEVHARAVARHAGRSRIGQRAPMETAGAVRRQVEPAHLHRHVARFAADLAGQRPAALSHAGAETFVRGGHVDELQHGVRVPPGYRHSVALLLGQEPFLLALGDQSDHLTHRYGVDAVTVAHLVALGDAGEVVVEQVGAEHADGLVFRPRSLGHGVRPLLDLDHSLAPDRARPAGIRLYEDVVRIRRPVDLGQDLVVLTLLPVLEGYVAEHRADLEVRVGAERLERLDHQGLGVVLHDFLSPLFQGIGVGDLDLLAGAHHGYRLEVLGTHHRAHAGAACDVVLVVHYRRELDAFLAGRTDRRDLGLLAGLIR